VARLRPVTLILASAALAAGLPGGDARAANRYLEVPPAEESAGSKAYRYANLGGEEAIAELDRRGVPYVPAIAPMPGVRTPVRLTGPLHGVHIHSALPEEQRAASPFEILDARLALALDDFASILEVHDVVELVHFTMYRPASATPADPNAPQTRHPGGMAIDVGSLRKRDGRWLVVGSHWPAEIGARTCGSTGRKLKNVRGRELRSIVCEAADQRIFHYMLTPHFDAAHHDHVHLEIKPEVKWFLVN
jgi:hypothetical protein